MFYSFDVGMYVTYGGKLFEVSGHEELPKRRMLPISSKLNDFLTLAELRDPKKPLIFVLGFRKVGIKNGADEVSVHICS